MDQIVLGMASESASALSQARYDEDAVFAFGIVSATNDAISRRVDSANQGWPYFTHHRQTGAPDERHGHRSLPLGLHSDWRPIFAFELTDGAAAGRVQSWLYSFRSAGLVAPAKAAMFQDDVSRFPTATTPRDHIFNSTNNIRTLSSTQISEAYAAEVSRSLDGKYEMPEDPLQLLCTLIETFMTENQIDYYRLI